MDDFCHARNKMAMAQGEKSPEIFPPCRKFRADKVFSARIAGRFNRLDGTTLLKQRQTRTGGEKEARNNKKTSCDFLHIFIVTTIGLLGNDYLYKSDGLFIEISLGLGSFE